MATKEEYAALSAASYPHDAGTEVPPPGHWRLMIPTVSDASGFSARVYINEDTDEIVIAYTGTDESKVLDFATGNIPAGSALTSAQVQSAIEVYSLVQSLNPNATISFTGHSLGGGLASLMAVYFDREATIFNPAPFENSATNAAVVAGYYLYYLALQAFLGRDVDSAFSLYAGSFAQLFLSREQKVKSHVTDGEILLWARQFIDEPLGFGTIIGHETVYSPGTTHLTEGFIEGLTGRSYLHSMDLLAAMINSTAFRNALDNIPYAVDLFFDSSLYGSETDGQEKPSFLKFILRNQFGVDGTLNPNGNGMLDRFAADLGKLVGTGTAKTGKIREGLIAAAMNYYYSTNFETQGGGTLEEFFEVVPGGIRFDATRIPSDDNDRGFRRLVTSIREFTPNPSDTARVEATALLARDWTIQGGDGALIATGGASGDVMIGGAADDELSGGADGDALIGRSGDDTLEGDSGNDVLVGGSGLDTLDGGSDNDYLSGEFDDDILVGGPGADLLRGGPGVDLYRFETGDGSDVIEDSDGEGAIEFNGGSVQAGDRLSETKWRSIGGGLILERRAVAAGGGTGYNLLITDEAGTVAITIRNWADGMLGITLPNDDVPVPEDVANAPNETDTTILGDVAPLLDANNNVVRDQWGNIVPDGPAPNTADSINDTPGNDLILAGGGHDFVNAFRGGIDVIDGGAGNDHLNAFDSDEVDLIGGEGRDWLQASAAGDDILQGSAGDDVLHGYGGRDQLFGDEVISLAQAIENGRTDTGIAVYGDFLDSGVGDDILVGGATQDFLSGGAGNDLLIGGAGKDFLSGDGYYNVLVSFGTSQGLSWNWSVSLTITQGNGTNTYDYTLNGGSTYDGGGFAGDDIIYAGAGDDDVLAGYGDDWVYAEDGNDIVFGAGGNDTLLGGEGNDLLDGGDEDNDPTGRDYLDGGAGDDQLSGGDGDDQLFGGADSDILVGDNGNERDGNDYLDGEDGNDELSGGGGADIMYGGAGNDELFGESSDTPEEVQGNDYLDGGAGNDTLVGAGAADRLYGGDGDDTLAGDAGNTPEALHGDDFLDGGAGNDTLIGEGGRDRMFGGDGNDTLSGESGTTPVGVHADDFLDGGAGNDILIGEGGDDTLLGGDGNDQLFGESINTPASVAGNDLLMGGAGDDVLGGDAGSDSLLGEDGDDQLFGDRSDLPANLQGDDYLDGGAGNDHLQAYGGNDSLFGGTGDDVLLGMEGDDSLAGGAGADILQGGDGDDNLAGNQDGDTLSGGAGNDFLSGGEGSDSLSGDGGNDVLSGGSGDDLYFLGPGFGSDRITDGLRTTGGPGNTVIFQFSLNGPVLVLGLGSLKISFTDRPDELHLDGFDPQNPYANPVIDQFQFTNTTLTYTQLLALGFDIGGTPDADLLVGTGADDRIDALASDDAILGYAGNDRLNGGLGADTMQGGTGNDTFVVDDAGDEVVELAGEGTDVVESSISYTLTDYVENLTLVGTATDGTGNAFGNVITGNAQNNVLNGLGGNDILIGGAGDDVYIVQNSGDAVFEDADEGTDVVQSSVTYAISGHVETLILTGTDAINGLGNIFDNTIIGNSADNILVGEDGIDTLQGGLGNDHYIVGDLSDAIIENAGEGTDHVDSSVTYTLGANVENLTLTGAAAINGTGNELANVITGNSAGNRLDGGAGIDTMTGGAGNDTYIVDNAADVINETSASDFDRVESSATYTLAPTARVETFVLTGAAAINATGNSFTQRYEGNDANNVITANSDSTLIGRGGDDTLIAIGNFGNTLDGGEGADTMQGGAEGDLYIVDNSADVIIEAVNAGFDSVFASASHALSANVEDLFLQGTDDIDGSGNDLDNQIDGNDGANALAGLGGLDTIFGRAGDDTIDGGGDADFIDGGDGDDTIFGGAGNDTLRDFRDRVIFNFAQGGGTNVLAGGAGNDVYTVGSELSFEASTSTVIENVDEGYDIVNSAGSFVLGENIERLNLREVLDQFGDPVATDGTGNASDNWIQGTDVRNTLRGLGGDDFIDGFSGNDTIFGGDGDDQLDGGNDEVFMGAEGSVYVPLENEDTIDGGAGDDSIDGQSGDDILLGGAGDDFIYGGGEGDGDAETGEYLSNNDEIDGGDGDDFIDGGTGSDLLLGGAGDDTIYGGAQSFTGDPDYDILDGGTGIDYMAGGVGDDDYYVDGTFVDEADPTAVDECGNPIEGATRRIWTTDIIQEFEDEGLDWVYSTATIVLPANFERVELLGTDSLDATSGDGEEELVGNAGNNRLDGGAGADILIGGLGNDTLVVDDIADEVVELAGEGIDTIETSLDYTLGDNFENLTLTGDAVTGTGNAVANVLRGTGGANTLIGLGGNDELNGGAGNDSLQGGDGDDVYRFGVGSGVDTVTDIVGLNTVRLLGNLTGSDLTLTQSGNDLILTINGTTDQLTLQGWAAVTVLASGNIRLCECGCPVDFGNDPPVAVNDAATVTEDGTLVATGNVLANDTDPDADVLTVANPGTYNGTYGTLVLGAAGGYTYTLNNTLALVQALGQGETELDVFGYTAQDAQPLTDTADLTVSVHGANDLPVVATPIADQAGEENAPFSFTVPSGTFTDIDRNDVLAYTAALANGSALPAWLTFNPTTRQFTGTPPAGAAGTYQVRVTATDLFAATANDVFALVVAQNDPTSDTLQFTADACWPSGSVSASGVCIDGLKQTYGVYDGGAGVDTLIGTEDGDAILLEDETSPRPPGTSGPRIISVEIIDAAGGDDVVDLSSTLYTYGDVTVRGGAGSDTLIGGAGHNTLLGGEGCDTLTGGAVSDVLDGGAGDDSMAGGLGDDTYRVDSESDVVTEGQDAGTDTVASSVSICLADNVENLVLTGTAVFGEGNDLANTITGNASANVIDGGYGADVLAGGAGDDVYYVDEAGDIVVENAGEGTDEVRSKISLVLGANVENLTLLEGDACATATGNALANVLTGNSGDNVLDGAGGADTLVGGAGKDTYIVDVTGDVITELVGEGIDSVESSATFTLSANVENLTLVGTSDINGTGNALANAITGNTGSNELTGGAGNDVLRGGAGADTYLFSAGAGHDVVQDTIELDANCNPAEDAATDVVRFDATITPADVVFSVSPTHAHALRIGITSTGDSITLQGFLAHDDVADRIEEFRFSNGTVWTAAQVLAGFSRIVGTEDKDVLNAVAGGSLLYGLGDEDVLNGGAGNDVLDGGANSDVMTGGAGNDAYFVDSVNDETIEGASGGTDTVYASIDWTLAANVENLTLDGDTYKGTGNALANTLIGNSSANELDGGAGADTMIGGTGDDTYIIDNVGDVVVENADEGWDHVHSTISYTLGATMEGVELLGTANIDAIGNAADNLLDGNSGNNLLDGGAGEDDMWGRGGNDTYIVDSEYDQVHESSNQGSDTVRSTVSWALGSNVENLVLLGTAAINGTGNSLANALTGNSASNDLNGGGGADTMSGGAGDDTYTVNVAGDQVLENAGEGIDLVKSSVTFTLGAAVENLTLTGSAAVDGYGNALDNVLIGAGGANRLESYAGNDTLDGGGGNDTMIGGAGNDVYFVNATGDVVTENAAEGFDTVNSSVGGSVAANIEALFLTGGSAVNVTGNSLDNFLRGNTAANTLTGGAGIDVLEGGSGADTLTDTAGAGLFFGGAGADTLTGSALADFLAGGAGNDVINTGGGSDVIVFNAGDGKDTVNANTVADDTLSLGGGILYADLLFKKSGNNLILITGSNEQLTFVDWYAGSGNHSVDTLQVVIEGSADYDGLSSDPLRNHHVQTFDFESLVAQFDAARAANPSLTTWALTNALAAFHLSGSDTAAIGADLAYRYGRFGTLSDISFVPATGILGASGFGSTAQALQTLAALQDASPRLS